MRKIQSHSRSDSNSGKESKVGNINNVNGQKNSKSIISLANEKISLLKILNQFNFNIEKKNNFSEWSIPIKCPFPSHKSGGEKTPSFGYSFKKDFFNCFGCGKSGGAVDFIAEYKNINKINIAYQLLNEANINIQNTEQLLPQNEIITNLLFEFSSWVQIFIKNNIDQLDQIEKVLWWFDHYIYENIPKNKVSVDDLIVRISKAKEILKGIFDE